LANLSYPKHPLPIGILRNIQKPTFDEVLRSHEELAKKNAKIKTLNDLINSGVTWTIE
jgi:hypothetical protein